MAQQAPGRLEEQIAYLTEWSEHLSQIQLQPLAVPTRRKKATMNYIKNTMHKLWAS
jgi:hypothetical protein